MNKTKKLITSLVTLISTVSVISCTASYLSENMFKKDQYTLITNDGYYAETTYYKTREAYNEYLKNTNEDGVSKKKSTAKYLDSLTEQQDFVIAAVQKVMVYEEKDDDGNVVCSIVDGTPKPDIKKGLVDFEGGGSGSNNADIYQIGTNSRSSYYLNVSLVVYFNTKTNKYEIETNTGWDEPSALFVADEQKAEPNSFDFIGITWGGNGELHGEVSSVSGVYNGNSCVQFPFYDEDNFRGYIYGDLKKSQIYLARG